MNYYGAKELASSFRTVRNNTIQIAEDIGEEHYGFRATPETRSVAETLIHVTRIPDIAYEIHAARKLNTMAGFDFMGLIGPILADEKSGRSKADILKQLAEGRDKFAGWLEGVSDSFLGEAVSTPQGGEAASRTRFDMILGVKEHEMHHRGQLMLMERMVGIVPHLTRRFEAMRAQMQQQTATKQ